MSMSCKYFPVRSNLSLINFEYFLRKKLFMLKKIKHLKQILYVSRDENLALMTTTATAGTFSTNLSVFKCVKSLIHRVHL